jgi:hypothetical protein
MKTAEELGISADIHKGLIKVAKLMEAGKFKRAGEDEVGQYLFNMGDWGLCHYSPRRHCGTPACIAGWVDRLTTDAKLTEQAMWYSRSIPEGLFRLCVISGMSPDDYRKVTPKQAARAIRSYLDTGEANWHKILRRK